MPETLRIAFNTLYQQAVAAGPAGFAKAGDRLKIDPDRRDPWHLD